MQKPPSRRNRLRSSSGRKIVIYSPARGKHRYYDDDNYHHRNCTYTCTREVKTRSTDESQSELFFLSLSYLIPRRGLTDCSRADPSGSRSIFLVPKHEQGPPLATRYIVVPDPLSPPTTPLATTAVIHGQLHTHTHSPYTVCVCVCTV